MTLNVVSLVHSGTDNINGMMITIAKSNYCRHYCINRDLELFGTNYKMKVTLSAASKVSYFSFVNLKTLKKGIEKTRPLLNAAFVILFQSYLDENCDGFFRLPMPERLYCYYDGKGVNDVFVFENLLADSFVNFTNEDLEEQVRSIYSFKTTSIAKMLALYTWKRINV